MQTICTKYRPSQGAQPFGDNMTTKNKHAVQLGRLGGLANKGIKKPKSAENGKKGGRPRKNKDTANA